METPPTVEKRGGDMLSEKADALGGSLIPTSLDSDGESLGRTGAAGGETDESGDERCVKRPRVGDGGLGGGLPPQSPHHVGGGVEVPLFDKKTERPVDN